MIRGDLQQFTVVETPSICVRGGRQRAWDKWARRRMPGKNPNHEMLLREIKVHDQSPEPKKRVGPPDRSNSRNFG